MVSERVRHSVPMRIFAAVLIALAITWMVLFGMGKISVLLFWLPLLIIGVVAFTFFKSS